VTTEIVSNAVPQVLPGQRAVTSPEQVRPGTRARRGRSSWARTTALTVSRLAPAASLVALDLVVLLLAVMVLGVGVADSVKLGALILLLFTTARLYRPRLSPSALDETPRLAGCALVAGAAAVALDLLVGTEPRVAVLHAGAAFAGLVVLARAAAYAVTTALRRKRVLAHRTLIVGGGEVAGQLVDALLEHPEYGLLPVGMADDDPLRGHAELPVARLSGEAGLAHLVEEHAARTVVVAFASIPESSVVDVVRTCDRLSCEIYVVPRLYEVRGFGPDTEAVWGIPLARLRRPTFRSLTWGAKRGMDVAVAATATLLLSPVLLACALLVRLETGPKVLFRQQRLGLDGQSFDLLKFRSLRPSSEEESAQRWSVVDDARIGPVGRFLRRTSLDELPQLWNILRGDMSLVGPRPERPHFVAEFSRRFPRYLDRHRVPVGLTGYAQINGLRGDTSIGDRARFDNQYIENWSLWLDVKIMLRTVAQVVRGAGK
jgi:exopolysaccharide biosynthesis polyprenyl glycosylphosphotransferase